MKTKLFSIFILCLLNIDAFSQDSNWIVAAEKFSYTNEKQDVVYDSVTSLFPSMILEKINSDNFRFLSSEEIVHKKLYELKKERTSLTLQLSKEIKERDSLFLKNYSKIELKDSINDSNKKITNLKEKIDENLINQKELEKELLFIEEDSSINNKTNLNQNTKSYSSFLSNILNNEENNNQIERISFYNNSTDKLFSPSNETLLNQDDYYKNGEFERQLVDSNIKCLITGNFTFYDEYFLVTVTAYSYPGANQIARITESASINELDYVSSIIARQLIPKLTNAAPINITIKSNIPDYYLFIDDVLYKDPLDVIVIDAGIHNIQFGAEGFKTLSANYFFSGNKDYTIEITFEKENPKKIGILLEKPFAGTIFSNGFEVSIDENETPYLLVNNQSVLGQATSEDGSSTFFYIPQSQIESSKNVSLNLNTLNINDYIEKRRRRMYNSYSVLLISLIPTFICYGQSSNYQNIYNNLSNEQKEIADRWDTAKNISIGISIGSGIYFGYELIRYLLAANKIIPEESTVVKDKKSNIKSE